MSGPRGSIRKGLRSTTSRFLGATSTVRKLPMPPFSQVRTATGERNDPTRFVEGVSFKGKLIGVLEVSEARGDRMCQEALAELKMAVRAAGEHKQRIIVNVAMDGIRLRDERSGDCLYHHPVHKISFIAQDMADTRAFGYIFGSPDAGHKFFGIKTEKAASLVVIAMRDLFQVVFELKKKEIEKARAQLEEGRDGVNKDAPLLLGTNGSSEIVSASLTSGAGGAIADLLDLQSELSSLQRGLTEISQKSKKSEEKGNFDPFEDSFKPSSFTRGDSTTSSGRSTHASTSSGPTPAPLAPPPSVVRGRGTTSNISDLKKSGDWSSHPDLGPNRQTSPHISKNDRYAVFQDLRQPSHELLSDCKPNVSESSVSIPNKPPREALDKEFSVSWSASHSDHGSSSQVLKYDIFTDLDPLGTGRSRPFVDRKDFFNDLRKPVRRLRELGDGEDSLPNSPRVQSGMIPPDVSALVASSSLYSSSNTLITSLPPITSSAGTTSVPDTTVTTYCFPNSFSPPECFDTDDFQQYTGKQREEFAPGTSFGFANFNSQFTSESPRSHQSEASASMPDDVSSAVAMSVALPPESFRDTPPSYSPISQGSPAQVSSVPGSPRMYPHVPRTKLYKQLTVGSASLSPKTLPRSHKFKKQSSFDGQWDSIEDLPPIQQSFSSHSSDISPRPRPRADLLKQKSSNSVSALSLRPMSRGSDLYSSPEPECHPFPNDISNLTFDDAPIPPPRPVQEKPPPLPPKNKLTHVVLKPPPRPPTDPHYNYINEYGSSPEDSPAPPLPVPQRKIHHAETPLCSSRVNKRSTETFQFPQTSISPTRSSSEVATKIPAIHTSPSTVPKTPVPSIDLANTSLDQLATALSVPVEQLAKMTVVELAACLAQLQLKQATDDAVSKALNDSDPSNKTSENTENERFACFETDFSKVPAVPSSFSVGKETLVTEDRYAVFKELRMSTKQKSVFDENFLTPQNSVEEEVSEVSSGTFKVNFDSDPHHDSIECKSSLSDEVEPSPKKNWNSQEQQFYEGVTVFRSPEISEYENFEPNFDAKFDDDFYSATVSEKSDTPINSPASLPLSSPMVHRPKSTSYKSPFLDNFSATLPSTKRGKFVAKSCGHFEDDFVPSKVEVDKYAVFRELSCREGKRSDQSISPFEDNFTGVREGTTDSGFVSNFEEHGSKLSSSVNDIHMSYREEHKPASRNCAEWHSSLSLPMNDRRRHSPFDDDFTNRSDRYEVLKEYDNDKEAGLEKEVSKFTHPGAGKFTSPYSDYQQCSQHTAPYEEQRNTPYEDQKSTGSLHSIQEENMHPRESPFEDNFEPEVLKNSYDSAGRHSSKEHETSYSPFSDQVTSSPHVSRITRPRVSSRPSFGSDCSDTRVAQLSEEPATISPSEKDGQWNESQEKDPFFSHENDKDKVGGEQVFADFEKAFKAPVKDVVDESSKDNTGDESVFEQSIFPEQEAEFKVSARFLKNDSQSDSTNIFRRDSDPFADEFFSERFEEKKALENCTPRDGGWDENFDNFEFKKKS